MKEVLEIIVIENNDVKSWKLSMSLFEKMESFKFVFMDQLMKLLLGKTNILSQALQQMSQNKALLSNWLQLLRMNSKNLEQVVEKIFLKQ